MLGREFDFIRLSVWRVLIEDLINICREAGYKRIFTTLPYPAELGPGEFVSGRVTVDPTDWPIEFYSEIERSIPLAADRFCHQEETETDIRGRGASERGRCIRNRVELQRHPSEAGPMPHCTSLALNGPWIFTSLSHWRTRGGQTWSPGTRRPLFSKRRSG